ncbi:MAG: enhanced serine sensitivity protein SseB [Erysipelotrichaceae bacterium]|nr:enhanced serine sensitivity protein SseB [Erysipelotrichaceae bacterium]
MDVDVKKPIENPRLKMLLNEFSRQDETGRNASAEAVAEELAMNARLLAVINIDENNIEHKEDGTAVFKQDSKISFEMFKDTKGTDYLPVYTDWDELKKNENYKNIHVNTLILSFDDISAITADKAGTVVNPFSHNFVITPSNLVSMKRHKEYLTKGYTSNVVEKETTVQIGDPADYPTEMAEAIRQYAKTDKAIKAIWLKRMIRENEESYLLVVDFDGDRNAVFSSIASVATSHLHNGIPVDMVPLHDRFGQNAATGEPFYRRKRGLFDFI